MGKILRNTSIFIKKPAAKPPERSGGCGAGSIAFHRNKNCPPTLAGGCFLCYILFSIAFYIHGKS